MLFMKKKIIIGIILLFVVAMGFLVVSNILSEPEDISSEKNISNEVSGEKDSNEIETKKSFYEKNKNNVISGEDAAYIAKPLLESQVVDSFTSKGLDVNKLYTSSVKYEPMQVAEDSSGHFYLIYKINIDGYIVTDNPRGSGHLHNDMDHSIYMNAITGEELKIEIVQVTNVSDL